MPMVIQLTTMFVMRAGRGTAFAVHPSGVTVFIVLLFPDGHAVFDFIDDVATSRKRFGAMPCAYTNPDGHLTDREITDSMYARGVLDSESLDCFRDDSLAFFDGKR